MTILRKLALAIANMVNRFASPSAEEWAQATQRELAFIRSDWAALVWALGSIRLLFERKTRPLAALADVPRASKDLRKKLQLRTWAGYTVTVSEAIWFTWFTFAAPHILQRTGCALMAAAMLVWTYQSFSRRPSTVPLGPAACATWYRSELERQRDFFRGGWLWLRLCVVIPGFSLFCLGGAIGDTKGTPRGYAMLAAAVAVFILIAIPNSLRIARKFQKQVDDLDAILEIPQ